MSNDYQIWQRAAEEAARSGGACLEQWRTKFSVREKGRADLVTEADHASQQLIKEFLQGQFPDHDFLGEEDPGAKQGRGPDRSAPPTWVVDPLDGTANYVHDVPAYCVSIGLVVAGEPVVGVIFDPRMNEIFSAAKGLGATLNGKTIRVSQTQTLSHSLLATGFPPEPSLQERNVHWWRLLCYQAQALRRTGSTALNLAYTACGRFDGYWAFDNYAWDVMAGIVLVQEAGGKVTRINGDVIDPFQNDNLATNGTIHGELLALFNGK
jgi:myo-inositol-1(or 4)-monophosphatase